MSSPYPGHSQPTQVPQAPPKNGLGTAGFVCGLIGLVLAFIPLIGIVAWPLVIVGIVLSILGVQRAKRGTADNKGLAIAGVVCSAVGLVICILWTAVFNQAAEDLENAGAAQPGTQAPALAGDDGGDDAGAAGTVGDPVRDGKFEFTVTKVEEGIQRVGGEYVGESAQGQFVIVHVTVANTGDKAQMLGASNQTLIDSQGRKFDASTGTAAMALPDSEAFLNQINPGNSVSAQLLYDVPKGVDLASIELHDSAFSQGVTVELG